jgi:hypothetical protein
MIKTTTRRTPARPAGNPKPAPDIQPGIFLQWEARENPGILKRWRIVRMAYEHAPMDKEVETVWAALLHVKVASAADYKYLTDDIPSQRVKDALWDRYWPIVRHHKTLEEIRERARRRRVLAALERGKRK